MGRTERNGRRWRKGEAWPARPRDSRYSTWRTAVQSPAAPRLEHRRTAFYTRGTCRFRSSAAATAVRRGGTIIARLQAACRAVLVGRGVLRNPLISRRRPTLAQEASPGKSRPRTAAGSARVHRPADQRGVRRCGGSDTLRARRAAVQIPSDEPGGCRLRGHDRWVITSSARFGLVPQGVWTKVPPPADRESTEPESLGERAKWWGVFLSRSTSRLKPLCLLHLSSIDARPTGRVVRLNASPDFAVL